MASYTGGAKATSRIKALEAERKKQQDELARRKDNIAAASDHVLSKAAGDSFAARSETVEDLLKSDTVGLVTHQDFKARRRYLERCAADEKVKRDAAKRESEAEDRRKKLKKANRAALSFAGGSDSEDEEGEQHGSGTQKTKVEIVKRGEEGAVVKKRKLGKNPDVDTKYLPDREREIAEQAERERLRQAWINEQEAIKNEVVRITYSYWDGAGHRRVMRCKKGTTVGRFLSMVQAEFKELRNTSADQLMFIKEDLIIPHHYSFYDFIVTKARGVSSFTSCGYLSRVVHGTRRGADSDQNLTPTFL